MCNHATPLPVKKIVSAPIALLLHRMRCYDDQLHLYLECMTGLGLAAAQLSIQLSKYNLPLKWMSYHCRLGPHTKKEAKH